MHTPATDEVTGLATITAIAFKTFFFDPALYERKRAIAVREDTPRKVFAMVQKPRIIYVQQDKPRKVAV